MIRPLLLVLALAGALVPPSAQAQETGDRAGWDSERALDLARRAQLRRLEANTDTGLVNYRATARAFIYFYLDRDDTHERNLVKTDQLALEVYWHTPDLVKQRIIGWRDQESLPTNINYHLDHLSVVQENFGDEIRLGDGDEVRGVMHPAALGADAFYEFRLTDSLTLRLPGAVEPVRVYELRVRPRDPSRPAILGSVFIDRRDGALVRMDFTFTAAAYVDRYLDYINISLDNGLWNGRFWLPNAQRVEIRRRIPELDIPAGSVIRATMRVGEYRINDSLPATVFRGPPVVALPREEREAFEFEEDIHAEVLEEGIGPQAELTEIRRMAGELVRERALSRVAGLRLRVPRVSETLRYNRAEGLALNLGLTLTPRVGLRVGALGGWAFGADHPLASLEVTGQAGAGTVRASAYLNRPRDLGVGPVTSGVMNTLSSLFAAEDHTDVYYTKGAEISFTRPLTPSWRLVAGARGERQKSPGQEERFSVFAGTFRPVLPIDQADLSVGAWLGLARLAPSGVSRWWSGAVTAAAAGINPSGGECPQDSTCVPRFSGFFFKPVANLEAGRRWAAREAEVRLHGQSGFAFGEVPRQELFLVGGRGTIPGYGFRAYGGDRFATLNATAGANLWQPWLRGRLLAAAGWAGAGDASRRSLRPWEVEGTDNVLTSVGAGVGLVHDILHVDFARGLGEGSEWELIVEVRRAFWDFL